MSNGGSQIRHNTRERILSDDHNREQALGGQALAEILRFMFDAQNNLDTYAGGYEVLGTGDSVEAGGGLRGTVINGLRVRPEVGTTNCFIEPGVAVLIDTSAPGVDGSKAAFIIDPGVQSTGVLTLTPGSGGSVRIDVIECQRVTAVLEQDNRDIFNPSTGLFTPTLVSKIEAQRMAFRIRTGTAGAGFPGLAEGWMPLAVASVPAAATTWDQVTLWDVRPLASDRVNAPFNSSQDVATFHRARVSTDLATASHYKVFGWVETIYGGYRAGGLLTDGTNDHVDLADTAVQQSGYSFPTDGVWNLYALFPFGLPRWVRYSAAGSGQRVPRGMRGIPVLSTTQAGWNGNPLTAGVNSPTVLGLGDSASTNAVLLVSGLVTGGVPRGVQYDGAIAHPDATTWTTLSPSANTGTNDLGSSTWTLTDNTTHPAHAKAVWLWLYVDRDLTAIAGTPVGGVLHPGDVANLYTHNVVHVSDAGGSSGDAWCTTDLNAPTVITALGGSPGTPANAGVVRVPLAPGAMGSTANRVFKVKWNIAANNTSFPVLSAYEARVIGWEI